MGAKRSIVGTVAWIQYGMLSDAWLLALARSMPVASRQMRYSENRRMCEVP